MPLHRTPPKTDSPATGVSKSPLQHSFSDPNIVESINAASSLISVANRCIKRKRDDTDDISKSEILDLFSKLRDDQDAKFSAILNSINDVKLSMNTMSQKYEEVLQRLDHLEEEKKGYDSKIQFLEDKVETLERHTRGTSIEIRNIPQDPKERKEDLKSILSKTADVLNVTLDSAEIKDIYRIGAKSSVKPIIADFTTVLKRDEFIRSFKKLNKQPSTVKLCTESLSITGTSKLIYISENLTQRDRRLYFIAREFTKACDYAFCWISFGRIFIRKSEGSPHIRISCEGDLEKLKTKRID
ncbi:Zinc finger DNA binding protein [Operophtera brumata]|uniref:Zinc finger DNA binding protein n=1 Tax=Operophtera brumata TaxID=104452 RepID=A0A0L7LS11_OPEBR|nr:Zinc finger DNA binding protein [Operophtera brumata]KOB78232.1 Zinc finger DNA binding protein [Operophtera brumata]